MHFQLYHLLQFGAHGGSRTHKTQFLRLVCIPFHHTGKTLIWCTLLESNQPHLLFRQLHIRLCQRCVIWCPSTESNCKMQITKLLLYHLTTGAKHLERNTGIKPVSLAWKAKAQSLYQFRKTHCMQQV